MSNDYATDALISEIDAALSREPAGQVRCPGHDDLVSDVRLLLRCQRAQLMAHHQAMGLAGIVSAIVSGIIAAMGYFCGKPS
jgi:hypothetical protein